MTILDKLQCKISGLAGSSPPVVGQSYYLWDRETRFGSETDLHALSNSMATVLLRLRGI